MNVYWSEKEIQAWMRDNGMGIPAHHLERIFGVFETLHPCHSGQGTGIGLAIVTQAMQRMGGTVGVESSSGKGSQFWMELPKSAPVAHMEEHWAAAGNGQTRLKQFGAGVRN